MSGLSTILTSHTLRHRWLVIATSLVVFVFSAIGLSRLTIDSDLRVFFNTDIPKLLQLEAVEKTYLKNENILMVIVRGDNRVFAPEVLKLIKEMTTLVPLMLLVLVAGFLVLMLSDYRMSADMGLLSAITISLALIMDFLLLPAVLLIVDKR